MHLGGVSSCKTQKQTLSKSSADRSSILCGSFIAHGAPFPLSKVNMTTYFDLMLDHVLHRVLGNILHILQFFSYKVKLRQ